MFLEIEQTRRKGTHQKIIVGEAARVAIPPQQISNTLPSISLPKLINSSGIESQNIPHHSPLSGIEEIATLGKEGAEGCSSPFVETSIARDGEGHFGGDVGERFRCEEAQEVGVGDCVESTRDQKAISGV